jgi:hypothetical protein
MATGTVACPNKNNFNNNSFKKGYVAELISFRLIMNLESPKCHESRSGRTYAS